MSKNEKYIIARYSTRAGHTNEVTAYTVFIPYYLNGAKVKYNKNFPVKDYQGKPSVALKAAKRDRDTMLPIFQDLSNDRRKIVKTVEELYTSYKELHPSSQRTYRNYDSLFRTYIQKFSLADKPIEDITEADVLTTLNACAQNCCSRNVSKLNTLWHRIFYQALKNNLRVEDYTDGLVLPKSDKEFSNAMKRKKNITEEEFQTILECARNYGVIPESDKKRLYKRKIIADMLVVMRETGIRPAEAKAIHRGNISFSIVNGEEVATIQIVSSIGSTKTETLTEKETKTPTSVRPVYMYGESLSVLRDVLEYSRNELIFSDYDGNPFGIDELSDYIHRISKKCGIPFTLYLLRHSFCSDLYANGVSPSTIKDLCGHASEKMSLDIYAVSETDARIEAVLNRKKLTKSTK